MAATTAVTAVGVVIGPWATVGGWTSVRVIGAPPPPELTLDEAITAQRLATSDVLRCQERFEVASKAQSRARDALMEAQRRASAATNAITNAIEREVRAAAAQPAPPKDPPTEAGSAAEIHG